MKTFAICFLLLAASAGFVTTLPTIAHFCSGGDDDTPSRPAFLFDPELTGQPEYRPLYFTWNKYYDNLWDDDKFTRNDNLLEWRDYFGHRATPVDIERVIYTSTITEVEQIDGYLRKANPDLEASLRQNTVVKYVDSTRDLQFSSYLLFAKRCEPLVTERYSSWNDEGRDDEAKNKLRELLTGGKLLYEACSSEFLKLRYGYQLVRLAHYAEEFEECQEIYNTYVEPSKVASIMHYWALEQKMYPRL